jgi:hypothetical protein
MSVIEIIVHTGDPQEPGRSGETFPEREHADQTPPAASDYAALRDLPDYAMVDVSAEFSDVPHAIGYADSPAGLLPIIRAIPASYPAATEAHLAMLEAEILHEAEHAAAASALGCSSRFCITMTPLPGGGVHARPCHSCVSSRPLSKLALASITAAPSRLSPDDLADLRDMGYRDADDVAERIREFNRRACQPLPLPAGAKTRS